MIFKIALLSILSFTPWAFAQDCKLIKPYDHQAVETFSIGPNRRLYNAQGELIPTELAQAFYVFDLKQLYTCYEASDLLDSKLRYEKQFTQKKNTDLILPYQTLYDWNNLAHPPVQKLTWPLEKINKQTANYHSDLNSPLFHEKLDQLTQTELTANNQIQLLQNEHLQLKKEELLEKATKYFWGAVFLVRCDNETMPFYQKLIEKQKEGIDVRLMVDGMASVIDHGLCVKKLKKMGLPIYKVNTALKNLYREVLKFGNRKSTAFHPKFWIQDGEEIIVDGVNLLNVHIRANDHNQMYKDAGVQVKGPIVQDAVVNYISLWDQYIGKMASIMQDQLALAEKIKQLQRMQGKRGIAVSQSKFQNEGLCRFTLQDPLKNNFSSSLAIIASIQNASHYIALTPIEYFLDVGNKKQSLYTEFVKALQHQVSTKQVSLDYMINRYGSWEFFERYNDEKWQDHGKNFISRIINKKYKRWLNETGLYRVKSFLSELRAANDNVRGFAHYSFNHAKVLLVDNSMVAIGSHNMNDRSFLSDFESMLFCHDQGLAKEVNQMLAKDILNSTGIQ